MERECNLLESVAALRSPRRLASCLNGRQQKRDKYADDRDDHEKFDESECASGFRSSPKTA
jgi:hypothetical protein